MADPDEDLPDATPDRDYDTVAETPSRADAARRPKVPTTLPPPGSCDCDVALPHGPVADAAWADDLRARLATLEVGRAVLVDRGGTADAHRDEHAAFDALSAETRRILPLPRELDAATLDRLVGRGVVGFIARSPKADLVSRAGPLLAERGLLLEIEADDLAPIEDAIRDCPAGVVLIGLGPLGASPDAAPFATRLALVESGVASIKLCPGTASDDADPFVAALAAARPAACLWATGPANADPGQLLDAFFRAVTDTEVRQTILVDAPARLYGFIQ